MAVPADDTRTRVFEVVDQRTGDHYRVEGTGQAAELMRRLLKWGRFRASRLPGRKERDRLESDRGARSPA